MPREVMATRRSPTERSMKARRDGKTHPARDDRSVPRLPHERDESADSQQDTGNDIERRGQQAHDDLEAGREDTDLRPVIERVSRRMRQGS